MGGIPPFEQRWRTPRRFRPQGIVYGPAYRPLRRRRPIRLSDAERAVVRRLQRLVERVEAQR